jgi:predicted nucleic acid-binding protein
VKVYLDTSVYNRPFDDQTQPRICLETLAFVVVLQMVEAGDVELISSSVVEYENSRNPFPTRRQGVSGCLKLVTYVQKVDTEIRKRATILEEEGLKAIDALHVACAEKAGSEYFLTCDDQLTRRYQGAMSVTNPIEFALRVAGEP